MGPVTHDVLSRPRVRAISCHAHYACRHSGACCEAHWPIPVEVDRLAPLQEALRSGRIGPAGPDKAALVFPEGAPADTPAVIGTGGHVCAFRTAERCAIHAALGHDALPLSCRQFPRVVVIDPGGVSVTLSHYCPTAASLLEVHDTLTVVTEAPAFPADGEYVGLDARAGLPPLLRPDMAMDWHAWWEWEVHAVAHIGRDDTPLDDALRELAGVVESVRRWSPVDGSLVTAIRDAFNARRRPVAADSPDADALADVVLTSIPPEIRPDRTTRRPVPGEHVRRRFLAAHAFANWTAHLGLGLRAWLRSIQAADALLTCGLGVRQADLWLRHLADPHDLANAWSRADEEP